MLNVNEFKAARVRRGLTQEELAKRIGITPSKMSLKENGKALFSIRDIDAIIRELGLSGNEILNIFFFFVVALKDK